jgi:hypothetical protein
MYVCSFQDFHAKCIIARCSFLRTYSFAQTGLNARGNSLPKYNVCINRFECKGDSRIGFMNEKGTHNKVS